MSTHLDELVTSARARTLTDLAWDDARALRIREGALRRREARVRHRRLARRGLLVASGAALLLVALLRAASSAPARSAEEAEVMVAARALGDGGYAHD